MQSFCERAIQKPKKQHEVYKPQYVPNNCTCRKHERLLQKRGGGGGSVLCQMNQWDFLFASFISRDEKGLHISIIRKAKAWRCCLNMLQIYNEYSIKKFNLRLIFDSSNSLLTHLIHDPLTAAGSDLPSCEDVQNLLNK